LTIGRPSVLIVDDRPESLDPLVRAIEEFATADVAHPQTLRDEQLVQADVVLVDYVLDAWDELSGAPPARAPRDGLALAAVLRSQFDVPNGLQRSHPLLFALHSAELPRLSRGLPDEIREHVLARLNDLEWVFAKEGDEEGLKRLASRVAALADAGRRLPPIWPENTEDAQRELRELLSLDPDSEWFAAAWRSVMASYAPLHELSRTSHALALVRWLGHRILPYPCFLWDDHYLAARLQINVSVLREIVRDTDDGLGKALHELRYTGAMAGLVEDRWWRAGVEHRLWELRDGSTSSEAATDRIQSLTKRKLAFTGPGEVVLIDENYRPLMERAEPAESVRVQPDDWPPYADAAWTTLELARNHDRLRAIVVSDDEELIEEHEAVVPDGDSSEGARG
jgi:hypothetical protein